MNQEDRVIASLMKTYGRVVNVQKLMAFDALDPATSETVRLIVKDCGPEYTKERYEVEVYRLRKGDRGIQGTGQFIDDTIAILPWKYL